MALAAASERRAQGQGDGKKASARCNQRGQGLEQARPQDREEGGPCIRRRCMVGHAEDDQEWPG